MKNVDGPAVRLVDETDERLAELLSDDLAIELGQIAALCREGLMALSVEAGLAAARAIMAEEADALCGAWNARDPERSHVRGGTTPSSVVMGGQRLPIKRPRVHGVDGDGVNAGEVALETFGVFANGDLLSRTVMERMLAGVATRSFARVADPIGDQARSQATSTSKSAVSRRFVTGTKKALAELLARDLCDLDAAVLMIDGVDFAGSTCVVALIVTADGTKVPVGLRLGDTENKTLVKALLADLVDRGLDYSGGLLVVIDGAKALATAVRAVFGDLALIQRCQIRACQELCVRGSGDGGVDASGEGDGERVECLAPALGVGSELASSVVADVVDCQVQDLVDGIVGGERASGFGDFAELVVHGFDGVGGVDDLADV